MSNIRTVLVTGGSGFIGSNFIEYFIGKYPKYRVINLDKLTYAGKLSNNEEIADNPMYTFIHGDICDRNLVEKIFKEHDIRGVIHFAAESHVDNSISGPGVFIETNIGGTFTLLDVSKNYWMESPFTYKEKYKGCRFHHISTDEVYGSLGETGFFTEETSYTPNSPYSASKASSDMIVRSYVHTYGLDAVITNCSNNYGFKQHHEKLIPTVIRKAIALEEIPLYGDGLNIRDWLYVLDHCRAVDLVYHEGTAGDTYVVGGNNERNNRYIALKICEILDKLAPQYRENSAITSYKELISYVHDRPGHDRRYAIDSSKIEKELGWRQEENFESGIYKTVEWYLQNGIRKDSIKSDAHNLASR